MRKMMGLLLRIDGVETAIALDILPAPAISLLDSSQTTTDHAIQYAPTTAGQNFNLADGLVIVSNALNDPNAPVRLAGRSTYNADISYDGVVSFGELGPLTANWGRSTSSTSWAPTADINGDGFVSFGDLGPLTQQWGQSLG